MLDYRSMRLRLGEMVDPATVCRAFGDEYGPLTWHDLDLLATIEDFHREHADRGEQGDDNGAGCQDTDLG